LESLFGGGNEERAVSRLLHRLARRKTPVEVEVERSRSRFRSIIALKRGVVVIPRPKRLPARLKQGGWVRFTIPGGKGRTVRLEVLTPHFVLTTGTSVMLCRIPTAFGDPEHRAAERFHTARIDKLYLYLPETGTRYRLVDLSREGCRVYVRDDNPRVILPVGEVIRGAELLLDKRRVPLRALEPRSYGDRTVGCSLEVDANAAGAEPFFALLDALEKQVHANIPTIESL